eukprot:6187984-Pleurochrysis_carterae.AAC.1
MKGEDTAVSRSSRPRSRPGGWRLNAKCRGYSGRQANLTGTNGSLMTFSNVSALKLVSALAC